MAAACEATPSLVKMLLTWRSTVFSATNSWLAMGYGAVPVGPSWAVWSPGPSGFGHRSFSAPPSLVLAALMALPAFNNRTVAAARAAAES